MEKIKVNMNPNPLDVQTIHASQNDGEARQWEFELHNNGELIDTSEVTEQMFFKAYKGGTEQLLPENTSTPTTSPFLGDIRYPQGLLTDQEFTYRESPTESDGLAKITDIKGNTLVWNQLVPNGNFATNADWFTPFPQNGTLSIANNEATLTLTVNPSSNSDLVLRRNGITYAQGHKYLLSAEFYLPKATDIRYEIGGGGWGANINVSQANTWVRAPLIITRESAPTATVLTIYPNIYKGGYVSGDSYKIRNVMIIDLTQMGLDITDPSGFTSLFPLSYYSYNQGSLLSFNGNGIKTVGFNQWDEEWELGGLDVQNGNPYTDNSRIRTKNFNQCFENTVYYNFAPQQAIVLFYDGNFGYLGYVGANARSTFTTKANARYFKFYMATAYGTTYNNDICINISSSRNGEYEPYTSSTLSLPISTYFPSGMKSAGSVYDELTESKAITRIGRVDLGTLNWRAYTDVTTRKIYYATISGMDSTSAQIACDGLTAVPWGALQSMAEKTIQAHPSLSIVYACDSSCEDATEFTSVMSGVYLYYELATPTETSFSTASLVTENAEIPLSNEDGVLLGKCTEQLSENPGFIDAKIKLADDDGTCYSNKLQLHVERSPQ